ncbi:MAG: S46 family peptidase [Marinilabiliales bacterium]
MIKKLNILLVLVFLSLISFADGGMWIPILLKKYNIEDMQKKGFRLTAEDIYSINHSSMKDGVVIFGGGCTGELISDKGLIITNHHCGYAQIQQHSTIEHDYLTDGYWAKDYSEELANPGLTVTFLVRMEDVTDKVLQGINDTLETSKRNSLISKNIESIKNKESDNGKYEIEIKDFYYGNEYYMFVYKVYKDVRLVGAPPSSIGKFGGDTDNWMWPRHTGDFSIFRIYADKNNEPADYSPDNVPYKPDFYFPVSIDGVKEGDFTMVIGYPGSTQQFLTSYAVKQLVEKINPARIEIRDKQLNIINKAMEKDKKTRIQYSLKAARIANGWKKWIGENNGLKKLDAIKTKEEQEKDYISWINSDESRKKKYGHILSQFQSYYNELEPYYLTLIYLHEAFFSQDIFSYPTKMYQLKSLTGDELDTKLENLKKGVDKFFNDYDLSTDIQLFEAMLIEYYTKVDHVYHPDFYSIINKKFKGDFNKYTKFVYSKTIFSDKDKLMDFLNNYNEKSFSKLEKDPVFSMFKNIAEVYTGKIIFNYRSINSKIEELNHLYVKSLFEKNPDKLFYPDANFTMRVTYGNVSGYSPKDAVTYNYYTTLRGIIEKDNPEIYDYDVPEKLKELYNSKDYGIWGVDSIMPVCFIATNHTTGGNSGSPVINAKGELVGVNFDRNWEGTMSDIMYDPEICRNITLDIRYVMFIIDKFADADYLIKEMKLIKDDKEIDFSALNPD